MQKNKNIICIASTSWDTNFVQAIVQLISLLANENKVLYVDYAFTWIDVARSVFGRGNLRVLNMLGLKNRIRKVETEYKTQLYILSLPPILPINWISNVSVFNFFNKINYYIISKAILRAQKKLLLQNPYLINSWNPIFGINYKNELAQVLQVYFCYDEISASKWIGRHGSRLEKLFLPKVDMVITTSASLSKTKSVFNPNCLVVPNGVNFSLYNEYLSKPVDTVSIKKDKYQHVIGYIGAIDTRIDLELLMYSIQKLSEYLFVFIGRVTDEKINLTIGKLENTLFINNMSASELPKYVRDFSVCTIPFIKNDFTANVYPMKINEYLAMGKPVVLTDFNELPEFASVCSIVSNKEDFVMALQNEILNNNQEKISKRIEMATSNSWSKRADQFYNFMTGFKQS